jgi:hypothetical protein
MEELQMCVNNFRELDEFEVLKAEDYEEYGRLRCSAKYFRKDRRFHFLLALLFDPEDGGDIFLQNIGLPQKYTLELRIPYPSLNLQ